MNFINLIDGPSALIVFGGTALATVLRAGLSDCRVTLAKLRQLSAKPFDPDRARSELAAQIQEIQRDGLLRAHPRHFGDSEFDEATDALITRRSVPALLAAHEEHRARRVKESDSAVRTLAQAAELSPVFGLAGTLVSLSQLPVDGMVQGAFSGAISMAVVTTLYGLLGANLLLAPLARIIERKANAEEADRQAVIDWIAAQVEPVTQPRPLRPAVAAR
ncbi:MAG: MotA/TolQ/ExbB proton channel family protein [Novosphingobium sp.]